MPVLVAAALFAMKVGGELSLSVEMVEGRFLQVLVVSHGATAVIVTPRTILGCYVEVEIQDSGGHSVGHFGPRATCADPQLSEYRLLRPGELFGVRFDVLAPETVRLASAGHDVAPLEIGRDYRFVVTYHNYDNRRLSDPQMRVLRKSLSPFTAPIVTLRSKAVPYRPLG